MSQKSIDPPRQVSRRLPGAGPVFRIIKKGTKSIQKNVSAAPTSPRLLQRMVEPQRPSIKLTTNNGNANNRPSPISNSKMNTVNNNQIKTVNSKILKVSPTKESSNRSTRPPAQSNRPVTRPVSVRNPPLRISSPEIIAIKKVVKKIERVVTKSSNQSKRKNGEISDSNIINSKQSPSSQQTKSSPKLLPKENKKLKEKTKSPVIEDPVVSISFLKMLMLV